MRLNSPRSRAGGAPRSRPDDRTSGAVGRDARRGLIGALDAAKLGPVKPRTLTLVILAALAAGLAAGALLALASPPWRGQLVAVTDALGGLWLDALRMTLVPLVFSLIVVGVAQAAGAMRAGGLAALTLAAIAGLLVASAAFGAVAAPAWLALWPPPAAATAALRASAAGLAGQAPTSAAASLAAQLGAFVPANPIKAAAEGSMAGVVVFALAFGFAAQVQEESRRAMLAGFFDAVQAAMMSIVKGVLLAAPAGVALLAVGLGSRLGASAIGLLGEYVILISALCLASGLGALVVGMVGGRRPPAQLAAALAPVWAVALSTQSSLACLPLMVGAGERLGIDARVRDLVLPMAVALYRVTSPAANIGVAIYAARVFGVPLDPGRLVAGVAVSAVMSVAAVGVASSITFFTTLAPICAAMGVPLELLPLLLPLETLPDFSRTLGNVTADVALAAWADRWRPAQSAGVSG